MSHTYVPPARNALQGLTNEPFAPPTDEAEAVALAMVQSRWGNGCCVTADDRQKAREFIAAADALLKLRLAQQGRAKGLAVGQYLCLERRSRGMLCTFNFGASGRCLCHDHYDGCGSIPPVDGAAPAPERASEEDGA